jgi:gamma-glutamylcyclotransferase (GGCT)/AIG2-like uncharacterized protein YtfP
MHKVFVYGTLLSGESNDISNLIKNPVFRGAARVCGQLFDLGAYPGLVLGANCADGFVVGELYEVNDRALAILDALEEIGEAVSGPLRIGRHEGDEYLRVMTQCLFADRTLPCWVYELRSPYLAGARRIDCGDWRRRI